MKRILRSVLLLAAVSFALPLGAQSVRDEIFACPEKSGNIYYNYYYVPQDYTPAPEGYEPFYLSHYGRHGSRWLTSASYYNEVKEVFDAASAEGVLTPFGEDVYKRVQAVYEDGIFRYGDLSRLGAVQHREIASRMYASFPEVFRSGASIEAVSTVVPRCILSMAAFCERLKELEPSLEISREASKRTTRYLNCFDASTHPELSDDFHAYRSSDAPWRQEYDDAAGEYIRTERIMGLLFSDRKYADGIDAVDLVRGLYFFASDMQDIDLGISFYDLFTPDELYRISVYENYRYFVTNGPSSINRGFPEYYGRLLLADIISKADRAIEAGAPCADLRFGHDTNVMPLLTMLQFTDYTYDRDETDMEAVAEDWTLYKLSPMAANIQLVFYRKASSPDKSDVLVRIMHNEKEMHLPLAAVDGPYYRWSDVREFYTSYIASLEDPSKS